MFYGDREKSGIRRMVAAFAAGTLAFAGYSTPPVQETQRPGVRATVEPTAAPVPRLLTSFMLFFRINCVY